MTYPCNGSRNRGFRPIDFAGAFDGSGFTKFEFENTTSKVAASGETMLIGTMEAKTPFETKVEETTQALVEQYGQFGAKWDSFSLVSGKDKTGVDLLALIYNPCIGINLTRMYPGLCEEITQEPDQDSNISRYFDQLWNDNSHELELKSGDIVDARGLTKHIYKAWISKLVDGDISPYPDSKLVSNWPGALLPSKTAADRKGNIHYLEVGNNGDVVECQITANNGLDFICFRPTVVFELNNFI